MIQRKPSGLSELQQVMYAGLPLTSGDIFLRRWFDSIGGAGAGVWTNQVEFETKRGRVLDITALRAFYLIAIVDAGQPSNYHLQEDYFFLGSLRWRITVNGSPPFDYGESFTKEEKPPGEFIVLNRNVLGEAEDGDTHLIIEENSKVQLDIWKSASLPVTTGFMGFHMLGRWIPQAVYNRYKAEVRGS